MATNPHTIEEDDDEFDWEAAVREIDVACSSGGTSALLKSVEQKNGKKLNVINNYCTKQSTLDRFIGVSSRNLKKPVENEEFCNDYVDEGEGVEMVNGFVQIDPQAAKTWIYPVNVPRRDYQFSITRTALFANTLVVLPTGLGKTLIAAVVMYNYFRWFPEGKIVFAAPSRPLVMQQIEACHNIVGIPQEWTIDLTGQTSPTRRAGLWKDKRVFFVTPQVLEKDIHSGSCLVKHLVCLVIDEAHRATGNYSYCVAVRELMDTPVQLRILALTATPGSKQQTIQNVINNLQISTLEYRNESDSDVLPYVNERKIELIQVAMGNEADEINSLLLEVVRPYVARLCAFGVLQKRDFQTLSPCDLLNSRDKFRQEPPLDLPHINYGEVEGYFGVLITLYHVRKLLSSHGIKPAFEMLDEKLKQGYFARLMSRNEVLLKAKLLMQQTVSHGAPSPKLAKLLEVLNEHFKVKDPQNSRVIIFSNFRGSVRDILNALTNIGEFVRATEFIGQSSGKTSKGQSQKVQQAVLQKFRTGGYNVIVATSIGEEGLDIMEVDLVICFDANVSPLRMIQRMGRTGRKHEGRVVVLACEGSELKGYMRKKANSKTIKKHMYNGGMNSFSFHSSPRMVPHSFKPEVQFLEMSIEKFIPRGKKLKDDDLIPVPMYKTKLTDSETDLLAKYFPCTEKIAWKPSLIAFPHFQEFPSPVDKVLHSCRTGMLIDTMQHLQGLTSSDHFKNHFIKDEDSPDPCLRVDTLEFHDEIVKERFADPDEEILKTEVVESGTENGEIARTEDKSIEDSHKEKPCLHTFLFGSEFVSVDDLGNVLVLSLPQLPLVSRTKLINCNDTASEHHLRHNSRKHEKNTMRTTANATLQSECPQEEESLLESSPMNPDVQKGEVLSAPEKIFQTPSSSRKLKEMGISGKDHNVAYDGTLMHISDESGDEYSELSPRLTNFIKSGIVPESPINNAGVTGTQNSEGNSKGPALVHSQNMQTEFMMNSRQPDVKVTQDENLSKMDVPCSNNDDIQIPILRLSNNSMEACMPPVPVDPEAQTPFAKSSNTSSSRDWLLDSGENPETVEQQCKFRRLRKLGDINRKLSPQLNGRAAPNRRLKTSRVNGAKKRTNDVAVFIDEEAEVSSEGMASADEEGEQVNSSYEDSFIDDGTNSTSTNTQVGASRIDMMAVYRRSLLSQSPFQNLPNSTNFSPDSVVQNSQMHASRSSSGTKDNHTPQTGPESTAMNSQSARDRILTELVENENKQDSRKRKLSFYQGQSVPMVNLDKEFSIFCEAAGENSLKQIHTERTEVKEDVFVDEDDHFFECIDLDAVEEEAAKLLRYKLEGSTQKTDTVSEPVEQNFGILGSPNFDLGV